MFLTNVLLIMEIVQCKQQSRLFCWTSGADIRPFLNLALLAASTAGVPDLRVSLQPIRFRTPPILGGIAVLEQKGYETNGVAAVAQLGLRMRLKKRAKQWHT